MHNLDPHGTQALGGGGGATRPYSGRFWVGVCRLPSSGSKIRPRFLRVLHSKSYLVLDICLISKDISLFVQLIPPKYNCLYANQDYAIELRL